MVSLTLCEVNLCEVIRSDQHGHGYVYNMVKSKSGQLHSLLKYVFVIEKMRQPTGFEPVALRLATVFAADCTRNSLTRGSGEESLDPRVMCTSLHRIFIINKVSDPCGSWFGLRGVLT